MLLCCCSCGTCSFAAAAAAASSCAAAAFAFCVSSILRNISVMIFSVVFVFSSIVVILFAKLSILVYRLCVVLCISVPSVVIMLFISSAMFTSFGICCGDWKFGVFECVCVCVCVVFTFAFMFRCGVVFDDDVLHNVVVLYEYDDDDEADG